MGLKTTNYSVPSLGVTLDAAYALISDLYVDKQGNGKAVFEIQQSRENALGLAPLESVEVNFTADKTGAIYDQAYTAGKAQKFNGWQDDIGAN